MAQTACSTELIDLTESEWRENYPLVTTPLNPNACFDGRLFETYGAELVFVLAQDERRVWTLIECDGDDAILSGLHLATASATS